MSKAFKPTGIVCHESASLWGDAAAIRQWHHARGFSDIGYHAVILNGRRDSTLRYQKNLDGKIEPGRPLDQQGAHCAAGGMNRRTLGVCLIGIPGHNGYPTDRQYDALIHVLATWCRRFGIAPIRITQHSDHDRGKPLCASLDMAQVRVDVLQRLKE